MFDALKSLLSIGLILVCVSACANGKELNCELTNTAFEAMPPVAVTITREDGSEVTLVAKLANTGSSRAAGFQRICPSVMKNTAILFVFDHELLPSFHMNNVVAAIDIAFIRKSSYIDSIVTMQPYSLVLKNKPTYSPNRPSIAALETYEGFYEDNLITRSSRIRWQTLSATH